MRRPVSGTSPRRCSAGPKRLLRQSFSSSLRAHPQAVQALTPLFDAIGQRHFVVSEQPEAANLVKLSGNFLIASVIESLGEAVALVAKGGVDPTQYIELLTSTLFSAPAYQTYGGLIARREFEPAGFAAALGLKDIRLVLAAAENMQVPLPLASLLRDRFLTLLASGGGAAGLVGDRHAGIPGRRRRVGSGVTPLRVARRRRRRVRASPSSPARVAR